eukprot:Sspe_Gene.25276::Locus_10142_Transcript_6_10_Confidence_0.250_Length_548::g.25276::m.25276
MDCDVAASYKVERLQRDIHGEIEEAALIKTGLKKEFVWRSACPNPADLGLIGDNLLKKSDKMAWWKGQDVEVAVQGGAVQREEKEKPETRRSPPPHCQLPPHLSLPPTRPQSSPHVLARRTQEVLLPFP